MADKHTGQAQRTGVWQTYCVYCRCIIVGPNDGHLDACWAYRRINAKRVVADDRLTVTLTGMDGDALVIDGRAPVAEVAGEIASFSRAEKAALLALIREVTRALEGGRVSSGIIGGTFLSQGGIITNPGTSVVAGGQPQ